VDTVSVHDLVLDRALNPRLHGVDQEVVEFYAGIFKDVIWPPILVDRATHKLLDGWHRVEAAKRAGVYTLPVQWVDAKEEDLFALAVKANLGHGIRLSREERYKAIARLQREAWSPERITEVLGCSAGMVAKTEKAEDLRIKYKVHEHPAAKLPTETLVEVVRLPEEFRDDVAELAIEVEATAADVRRAVRGIKNGAVVSNPDIKRMMTDPEYAKAKLKNANPANSGDWLMTFATLVDQIESAQVQLNPLEREATVALFVRLRDWTNRNLVNLGAGTQFTMQQ
jgi:ParB-like chromosome segregation protein Spo0J